jgi:hypothetical protein
MRGIANRRLPGPRMNGDSPGLQVARGVSHIVAPQTRRRRRQTERHIENSIATIRRQITVVLTLMRSFQAKWNIEK